MYKFEKKFNECFIIKNSLPEFARELEELQRLVYPTLSESEIITEMHYINQIKVFPEGQFMVLDLCNKNKVVGMATTMLFNRTEKPHSFLEITDNLWINTHNPKGEWLYGIDVGVHTAYRGKGIAKEIYLMRQEVVKHFKLKGQLTYGMLIGFAKYSSKYTIEEYYEKVKFKEIYDPTVSTQEKMGFVIGPLIKNYLDDPSCGNACVELVWENNG